MKSERPADMLLNQYEKNAEMIRILMADNENIRKMLAAIGKVPGGTSKPPAAAVHQLRVVEQAQSENLNMREMVRAALAGPFPQGATKGQLIEFFKKAWSQETNPASLSVMLTMMRRSQELERDQGIWRFKQEGPGE